MKLYNTLSREKEDFKPLEDNEVRIYSCGPTVYNYAHIGNLRTYIFMDILRRVLRYEGYSIKHVMNITDVGHLVSDGDDGEDKLVKTAKEQKKSPWEIAQYYTSVFYNDIEELNIEKPEIVARATDHIKDMIEFVKILEDKGFAYETGDGIYFNIDKFPEYGKLSGINLEEQMAGARVLINDEKINPADFALWKKAPKEHIMQWESPWGMGYPGWHIECSAMGRKYLGDVFDIHTGGVDHIPIHHENEIAQSEALLGKPAVKFWMHGEFLLVDNGKMSKSLGNTYTVADLKNESYDPLAYRYFCLNAHYRSKLNFTWNAMKAAQVSYGRLLEESAAHKLATYGGIDTSIIEGFRKDFREAVADDLNIPKALGIAWNVIRFDIKDRAFFDLLLDFDKILGLKIDRAEIIKKEEDIDELDHEIVDLIEERIAARKGRNWARADEIRDLVKSMGYIIEDTKDGYNVIKVKDE